MKPEPDHRGLPRPFSQLIEKRVNHSIPQYCIPDQQGIIVRPLVEPEIWREVSLVTVRGRPHSPAIGALVREAMNTPWIGGEALAVQKVRAASGERADSRKRP